VHKSWTWWSSGGVDFSAGMLLDGPAVMMLFVVSLISLLVHIYSTDYVGGDRRYTHYFAFLSLFSASMLGLVMSESTLQLLTSWELVGLCSFALIGHWWEEKPNSDAALKAFIVNRVGDVGLICGVIILYFAAGTFDIREINELAVSGEISHLVLLVASCSLIAAVMSKSGQFILHTWLPDAMAGPTPVSALIHAATMVVAGIYMVGRLYGVFFQGLSIGVSSVNLLAVVGGVTVIGGAGLAFVQNDIKKVLAYSTVSQLGYMVMALGVGAWTAAFFHLFTHAMFKAGLFLGSGSVAHAVHSFDMKEDMGGMKRFMPKTYWTFLICTGALIGLFPLAGFWSKDEILAGASQLGGDGSYTAFMVVGAVGALMTAAYMTRCVYLTFHGEPRGHAADPHHPPHESGPRIVVPLYILSGLAIVAGLVNLPNTGALSFIPDSIALRFEHFYEPKGEYFPAVLGSFQHPEFDIGIALVSTLIGIVGIGLAYAWYFRGLGPHGITERSRLARLGHRVLVEKYYFDWLYTGVIAGAVKGPIARAAYWFNQKVLDGIVDGAGTSAVVGGRWVYDKIDQAVIDGAVNGSGTAAEHSGQGLRRMQTGRVQQYAALLFAGAALLAGIFIVVI
jgi:NADH-quinone oxidoreductase subunit L